jgi:tetratricopeptide (TPR) repeat protein
MGQYYLDKGDTTAIDRTMAEVIRSSSDKVGAYLLYGELLAQYSLKQAEGALELAIREDANDARGHRRMAAFLAGSTPPRFAEAADRLEKVLALRVQDEEAVRKQLIRYRIYADALVRASAELDRVLAAHPTDAEAMTLRGMLYAAQTDLVKARKEFDEAIRLNPNN